MHKAALMGAVFLAWHTAAFALQTDDGCPREGNVFVTGAGGVMWCVDGRLRHSARFGGRPVIIAVTVLRNDEQLMSFAFPTTDGIPVAKAKTNHIGYLRREGADTTVAFAPVGTDVTVVPALDAGGTLTLQVLAHRHNLIGLDPVAGEQLGVMRATTETLLADETFAGVRDNEPVVVLLKAPNQTLASEYRVVVTATRHQ